jgi:hypothetical protein
MTRNTPRVPVSSLNEDSDDHILTRPQVVQALTDERGEVVGVGADREVEPVDGDSI